MDELAYEVEVACNKCGLQIQQPVVGMHYDARAVCPNCGFHIFSAPKAQLKFRQAVVEAEEKLKAEDALNRLHQGTPK